MKHKNEKKLDKNIVYPDNPSGKFVPLMKVKQPDYIWYCAAPYGDAPKLEKKTLAEISEIISKKSDRTFNWVEGLLIPESMSDCQTNDECDYTNWIDKVFIADTGVLGFALFARVPIPSNTHFGYYGGQIETKQFRAQQNKPYQTHSLASEGMSEDVENHIKTTYYSGGMLSFCQSAPEKYIEECDLSYALSAVYIMAKRHGKFMLHEAITSRPLNAGEIITWHYGDFFWDNASRMLKIDELLLSTYGEPVIEVKNAKRYHQLFSQLKDLTTQVFRDVVGLINTQKQQTTPQNLQMTLVIYLLGHKKIGDDIQTALFTLPKRYLTLLSDQQRFVTNHFQGIIDNIRKESDPSDAKMQQYFQNGLAINNLQMPLAFENTKNQGVLAYKRGKSFFDCAQYELAVQFWQDALTLYSLWCKSQKIPGVMCGNEMIYKNLHIATYLMNIATALKRLERGQEAADTISKVCVLQKSMLPTLLFKDKTLDDLLRIRDQYNAIAHTNLEAT